MTTDCTRVILGTMLGNDFLGVYVHALENITKGNTGDEILPRPTEDIRTIKDAVGYVIAWPRTHVSFVLCNARKIKDDVGYIIIILQLI